MGRFLAPSARGDAWIEESEGEDMARGHGTQRRERANDVGSTESDWAGEGSQGNDIIALGGKI